MLEAKMKAKTWALFIKLVPGNIILRMIWKRYSNANDKKIKYLYKLAALGKSND
jgi:hypothetical protein